MQLRMRSRVNSYFVQREKDIVKKVLERIDCAHLPVYIVYPRNLQRKMKQCLVQLSG
jgi:hypothetical protein